MNLIIIDSNFICYKSMVAMKGLSWQEHGTGVIFGFLRQIQTLAEEFESPKFVFTWDSKKSYRRDVYPDYKKKPLSKPDPEMEDLFLAGKPQFAEIRLKVLSRLGFKNNFIQLGLEADDIITWIVNDHAWEYDHTYIVSSDEDLFQLLHPNVSIYNPREKTYFDRSNFIQEYGITPEEWYLVKAFAGCTSDNVKGIRGVGEKTLIKYLRKELPAESKKFLDIQEFDPSFNMSLVKLPHKRSYPVDLVEDELKFSEFEGVCLDYGFSSLLKKDFYNKWRSILKGE